MLRNDYFEEVEPIDRPIQAGSTQAEYASRNTGMILPEFTHFSLDGAPYLGTVVRVYEGWECKAVYYSGPTEEIDSGFTKRLKYHKEPIRATDPPTFARTLIEAPDPWRDPNAAGLLSGGMTSAVVAPATGGDMFPGRPSPAIPSSSMFAQDEIFRYYSLKQMGINVPKPQSVILQERQDAAMKEAVQSDLSDVPSAVPLDLTAGARDQQESDIMYAEMEANANTYLNDELMVLLDEKRAKTINNRTFSVERAKLVQGIKDIFEHHDRDSSIIDQWERAISTKYAQDNMPAPRQRARTVQAAATPPVAPVAPVVPPAAPPDPSAAGPSSSNAPGFTFSAGEPTLTGKGATQRILDNLDFARSTVYAGLTKSQTYGVIAGRLNVSANSVKTAYSQIFPAKP